MSTSNISDVVVRRRRESEVIRDRRLYAAIQRAFELQRRARLLEDELAGAKEIITKRTREFVGRRGTIMFRAGDVALSVTARCEAVIPEESVREVRRLLGRRFREMVSVRKKYLGTRLLLGGDSDAPPAGQGTEALEEAMRLIIVRELSPRFRWETAERF